MDGLSDDAQNTKSALKGADLIQFSSREFRMEGHPCPSMPARPVALWQSARERDNLGILDLLRHQVSFSQHRIASCITGLCGQKCKIQFIL